MSYYCPIDNATKLNLMSLLIQKCFVRKLEHVRGKIIDKVNLCLLGICSTVISVRM